MKNFYHFKSYSLIFLPQFLYKIDNLLIPYKGPVDKNKLGFLFNEKELQSFSSITFVSKQSR